MDTDAALLDDIRDLIAGIVPGDPLEAEHRATALAWATASDDLFRRVSPNVPDPHLVAYIVARDPGDGAILLTEHRRSGLRLPPGGHVEPGEHPVQTVRREIVEELGIEACFAEPFGERPQFVTVTRTVGDPTTQHHDVTLWFVVAVSRQARLRPDPREFASVRWWSEEELRRGQVERVEPHLARFLTKIAGPQRATASR